MKLTLSKHTALSFHMGAALQDSTSHEVVQSWIPYLFCLHSQIRYMFYFMHSEGCQRTGLDKRHLKDFHEDKQLEHSDYQVKI